MATEQIMSKAITKAVAEAMRANIQAMAEGVPEWSQGMVGPQIGVHVMKQPTFNWDSEDKYNKLKTFKYQGK